MALYRSPLTVTLWPSSFLKKYGPMIPPAHKAHQTLPKVHVWMMSELHQVVYFGRNLRKRPSRTNTTAINCLQTAADLVEAENLTDIHKGEDVLQLVQL
ncbi:hypothetical protein TNCV_111501 [Trichonephila clavipes]|nr:hypothetical protein TNCV_111501 [Trichonephila clavipes]